MKKCPNCGLETEDGQIFCHHCGARMEDVSRTDADTERLNGEIRKKDKLIADLKERLEQTERRSAGAAKKRKKWVVISVVLLAACVCSVIFAAYQGSEASYYRRRYNSMSSQYNTLENEYETLEEERTALKDQTDFMDQYIGIIDLNSEEYLYHTYSCPTWDWSEKWNILAYNVTAAENRDYEPCPQCH